jgi:hypothetical protein
MSVGQISFHQMYVGKKFAGEMPVGVMSVDQISFGKMSVG